MQISVPHDPATGSDSSRPSRGHILLVEDDPLQATYFSALFAKGDLVVTHVDSGEAAIQQLMELKTVDCLVSDINLPGMTGIELLRQAKTMRPRLPVFIMTSSVGVDFPLEALRADADDMVLKTSEGDEILRRVVALIVAGRAARRAAQRTVLAIGAHPDDVEIGAGGTLLLHGTREDRIIYLVLTAGEVGGTATTRVDEAERAAERLGATFVCGHLPDTVLAQTAAQGVIAPLIREYEPSVVYVHTPHDTHQDHRTAYAAIMVEARNVPNIYCYQSPSTHIDFRPTHFVDITTVLSKKVELIGLFQTQVGIRPYLADDMITATARYWGRFAGYKLVEPFEVVRQSSAS